MNVISVNVTTDGWALEFQDCVVMNGGKSEHIKDAAAMLGLYCDVVAVRCFPSLSNREQDYNEFILNQFVRYAGVPVVSMESATRHPLQSLADLVTIASFQNIPKPKIVLTWAPHVKPLPQAVANSFAEWVLAAGHPLTIAHPPGYALSSQFVQGATMFSNQQTAIDGADFVYVKNWSSYEDYGQMPEVADDWMLTTDRLTAAGNPYIMHCLPVRRGVEIADGVIDSPQSLVLQQATNRIYAAQAVLQTILMK
jgi:N-succinyl-L-ornithine transcarbamylase